MENCFPKFRGQEGTKKNTLPKFGNGKGIKKLIGTNSGTGIRGFHSPEWKGTGICAHPGQWPVIVWSNPGLCRDR